MFSVVPGGREVLLPFTRMWLNTGENLVRRELKGKEGARNKTRERKGRKAGEGQQLENGERKTTYMCVYIYVCVLYHTHTNINKIKPSNIFLKFSIKCKGLH